MNLLMIVVTLPVSIEQVRSLVSHERRESCLCEKPRQETERFFVFLLTFKASVDKHRGNRNNDPAALWISGLFIGNEWTEE